MRHLSTVFGIVMVFLLAFIMFELLWWFAIRPRLGNPAAGFDTWRYILEPIMAMLIAGLWVLLIAGPARGRRSDR